MDNFQIKSTNLMNAMEYMMLAMAESYNLDTFLQNVIQACADITKASSASLFLYDASKNQLVLHAEAGNRLFRGLRFNVKIDVKLGPSPIGLTSYVFNSNQSVFLNSEKLIYEHPEHLGKFDEQRYPDSQNKCQAWMGIPLPDTFNTNSSQPIGVITLENDTHQKNGGNITNKFFDDDQYEIIKRIAPMISKGYRWHSHHQERIQQVLSITPELLNNTLDLKGKLQKIINTYKTITNADGVSIWLLEGASLKCRCAIGDLQEKIDKAYYDVKATTGKIGVTPWILLHKQIIYTRTLDELYRHPDILNKYHNEYNSFIGAPLFVGNMASIGVIKAHKGKINVNDNEFFTTEDAQILQMLAILSAIAIMSHREFEHLHRHDQKIKNFFRIGSLCKTLNDNDEILWYLMVGITHNDGIGLNRVVIFELDQQYGGYVLVGKMAIGHKNREEGEIFQRGIEDKEIDTDDLDNSLYRYRNNSFKTPSNALQDFINGYRIHIIKDSPVYNLLSKSLSQAEPLKINDCEPELINFFNEIECSNPVVFSLNTDGRKCIVGFCDYLYTPEAEQEDIADTIISLANTFLNQIKLAISYTNSV